MLTSFCQFAIKAKAHDLPQNDKDVQIKSKTIRGYFSWPYQVLGFVPWVKTDSKIGLTYLKEVLLNSMPNIWSKQVYVQVFECKSITLKRLLICLNAWILLNLFAKV